MRFANLCLCLALCSACSSGDNGSDGAVPDIKVVDVGSNDIAPKDIGSKDVAVDVSGDLGAPDTTPLKCFDFSLDPNLPLAIDGTFGAKTSLWRRPHDDPPVCPATALLPATAALVPHVVYAFCNNDKVEHTFDFEMLAQTGRSGEPALDDPYLFLYTGQGIPADPLQCLAVNDDIPDTLNVKDSEITGVKVPPGGAITMVGTTFTFDPSDGTGAGYYVLVVTVNDP